MKHFADITSAAERVVDVAEDLMQQHGFNGFSYDDVAGRIGIKKPSIHHHFATKSELVTVVVQRYTHRVREYLLAIDGQHGDAPARLRAYAAMFERTYDRERRLCLCGMLGAELETLPEQVAGEVKRFFKINADWLGEVFAEGQAAGTVVGKPGGKPGAANLADAYLCALEGAMVVGRGMRSDRSPALVAETFLSTVLT
ncbi:TetR/AcrR family transcriptional regulator [Oxalobacteraceae bacterium]|nr:TetR/AcrR family transcriptional regulator [Oxalobacteraceae bacterium]